MVVCDFDMLFTFISCGWEGSAHDARVFDHALNTPEMDFPHPPPGKLVSLSGSNLMAFPVNPIYVKCMLVLV